MAEKDSEGMVTLSAEEHAKLLSDSDAMRSELEALRNQSAFNDRASQVTSVKVTRNVPAKLVRVMPNNVVTSPDGQVYEAGDEFLMPWGPLADEYETLGHIQIVSHDASDHKDLKSTTQNWEVKANAQ